MFIIDDKVVPVDQQLSLDKLDDSSHSIFDSGEHQDDQDIFGNSDSDGSMKLENENGSKGSIEKKDFHLDELQQIDQLYEQIEMEISELATREGQEIEYIEGLIETMADKKMLQAENGTIGGLDEIVELDESGGGDQVDDNQDEEDQKKDDTENKVPLDEEIERIHQLKLDLQQMIDAYEDKV